MRPFRRRAGRYVAVLEAGEVRLLADLLGQVRELLADRAGQGGDDPLIGMTGISVAPASAPDDPVLARLLPDFHREDAALADGMRMLHEPDVIAAKDGAAATVIDSLPADGGTVRLDGPTAGAWAAALNDIRLALGVRLEITEDDVPPAAASAAPDSPDYAIFATYQWVSAVQQSLLEVMMDEREGG